jgi:hypothetical protein
MFRNGWSATGRSDPSESSGCAVFFVELTLGVELSVYPAPWLTFGGSDDWAKETYLG